jgi:hypothetical protein
LSGAPIEGKNIPLATYQNLHQEWLDIHSHGKQGMTKMKQNSNSF